MSVLKPLSFGAISTENNLIFAPLAGFSHKSMRIHMKESGAGYCVTEMVSVEGLLRNSQKTFHYADISHAPNETSIQLFGSDPVRFAEAACILKEHFKVKSINVNFGCPAPKVQKGGGGSELLKNPTQMTEIIRALKKTGLTVEAKIRAGFESDKLEHLLDAVADADCIMVHCRLVRDRFLDGTADWQRFERARKHTSKTLIANGDIKTPEDALHILDRYGVDGIMIGRSALTRPYIFRQINQLYKSGQYQTPTVGEKIQSILDFSRLWMQTENTDNLTAIRGALMSRADNFEGAVKLRSLISACTTWDQLVEAIQFVKKNYCIEE
ncbi:MAG: tRNA dihydrouridine synthase [Brevinema sp.]